MKILEHYIEGKRHASTPNRTLEKIDPATENLLYLVPVAENDLIDVAIASAKKAQENGAPLAPNNEPKRFTKRLG